MINVATIANTPSLKPTTIKIKYLVNVYNVSLKHRIIKIFQSDLVKYIMIKNTLRLLIGAFHSKTQKSVNMEYIIRITIM